MLKYFVHPYRKEIQVIWRLIWPDSAVSFYIKKQNWKHFLIYNFYIKYTDLPKKNKFCTIYLISVFQYI